MKRKEAPRHLDHLSLGALGETLACNYLKKRNYAIIERNFRCKSGEVDIIARKGDTIVFVEVKTQYSHVKIRAERKVDARKQRKLKQLARYYKKVHLHSDSPCRIDVIIVCVNSQNRLERLKHYERAV